MFIPESKVCCRHGYDEVNIYYSSVRIYFKRNENQRDFIIENLGFSLTTFTLNFDLTLSQTFKVMSSVSRVGKQTRLKTQNLPIRIAFEFFVK